MLGPARPRIVAATEGREDVVGKGILERLAEGPVLGDGGYLLELEKRGYVQAGPFTPEVVIDHPEALAGLHREFLRAGAEVLQTMTFYASDDKLATVGLEGKVDEINRAAVTIAREVARESDALVAGNLSLTWAYDPADPASPDHVRALFDRQIGNQMDVGGPDFWIGETFSWLGEALLFVERAKATGLPVMVTLSFEKLPALTYEGDTPAARVCDVPSRLVTPPTAAAPAAPPAPPLDKPLTRAQRLVVVGADDPGAPPGESQHIAKLIPGSRFTEIPNARHLPNVERPEVFNQLLLDWLREHP